MDLLKLFIIFFLGFLIGLYFAPTYEICYSSKVNCDILLNKRTGQTWFNINGYWEKTTKDIAK